jgi:hypothetical protein
MNTNLGSACVLREMPVRLGLAVSHRNELPYNIFATDYAGFRDQSKDHNPFDPDGFGDSCEFVLIRGYDSDPRDLIPFSNREKSG